MSVEIINDSNVGLNFYGGKSSDGKKTVLVIDGTNWNWDNSKHMTHTFGHLPIGTKFTMDSKVTPNGKGGRTLEVEWDSLEIIDEQVTEDECAWIDEYHLNNAMAKKNRSLASAKKGIDADNLRKMTISDLRNHAMTMPKAKKAALIALIISELDY